MQEIRVAGLCGSLRKESFNRAALRLAARCMPTGMTLSELDIGAVPLFNGDDVASGVFPTAVLDLRAAIAAADAVLIASPEYNFSIPGVLKNTLDYLSRGQDQPFAGKPVAILSASMGMLGGARMQYELRKSLQFLDPMILQRPEVFIGAAQSKFTSDGTCTDETTTTLVREQMLAFQKWIVATRWMRGPVSTG